MIGRILAVWLLSASAVSAQELPALAVVVHPASAVEDLTMDDLRHLFLGQTSTWGDAGAVRLCEFAAERGTFYRSVLHMAETQIDRHWIGVVFRGDRIEPPVKVARIDELLRLVSATPGALAFVPLDSVSGGVKILSIEGVRPGEPSYPIG